MNVVTFTVSRYFHSFSQVNLKLKYTAKTFDRIGNTENIEVEQIKSTTTNIRNTQFLFNDVKQTKLENDLCTNTKMYIKQASTLCTGMIYDANALGRDVFNLNFNRAPETRN